MTLTECKQLMRLYRHDAEAGIVQFNWRTTARWSLRHRWACEENDKLRLALRDATARTEAAEAALAQCGDELEDLMAQRDSAEAALETERMAVREFAKAALFRTMSDLSETCWCAGWMDGTEYALWDAVEKNQPVWWGMEEVRQRDIDDLRRLRELSGGWWIWDDEHYETFVSIDQMTKLRQQKVQP